jgi:hypothetical protein
MIETATGNLIDCRKGTTRHSPFPFKPRVLKASLSNEQEKLSKSLYCENCGRCVA